MKVFLERKQHNKYSKFKEYKNNTLYFGNYGFKILKSHKIAQIQFENIKKSIERLLKLSAKSSTKVWYRIFINKNSTSLALESRMGKGKGSITSRYAFLKPGQILVEFNELTRHQFNLLYTLMHNKWSLPVKKLIKKI